jgi:hypothetical protein
MEEQLRNPFQGKINQDRYRFATAKRLAEASG